jgi:hypothetical protein
VGVKEEAEKKAENFTPAPFLNKAGAAKDFVSKSSREGECVSDDDSGEIGDNLE